MEVNAASSSDKGGHPRKRRRQADEGDRPSRHQTQRNGILAGDRADITLRDQFFGGHHHHHHGIPSVEDSATSSSEALIKSLSFPTMNSRRDYISEECPRTCEWLLNTAEWTQWQRSFEVTECPRLLWIKGHAGSGKSTIMKYAYDYALRSKKHGEEIVLAHFFNARAKERLDKSTEGMYRTILVQLLEALQPTNVPGDVTRRALDGRVNWHVETLLELLRDILRVHVDRPVTCFVDALDECDDDQARDMIRRFRDLIEKESKGVRVQLRVLFSSRHYPNILTPPPDKAVCMALERQPGHAWDITNYIESYLLVRDSPIAQDVIVGVQEKARGSFIWCKLVIDLLNKDNDEARLDRPFCLRERLAAIPPELDALLAEILGMSAEGRVSDPETVLCMQWVLFSMRELTPQELWWAIRRGVEPWTKSMELAASCEPEYSKHYIMWASRGLVEIVDDRKGRPIVQVIHESVRDFLVGQGKMAKLLGPEACEAEAVAHSHEQIKGICSNEIFVHAANVRIPQAVLKNVGGREHDKFRSQLAKELPLLRYATQQVVKHANAVQRCGVTSMDQQQFLDDLERHREQFNILRIASHNQPGDTFSREVDATLTGILLHANAEALIEPQYRRLDAAGVATHRFGLEAGFGVIQALVYGSRREAVKAVIDVHLQRHSLGDPRRDLLLTIAHRAPFYRIFGGYTFKDPLFSLAYANHYLGLFFLVAALPVTHEATELLATQPQSVLGNFNALLLFVLKNPLQFDNFQDFLDLEEALRWAAHQGDVVMAQMLLDNCLVDINTSISDFGTPLHYAVRQMHESMVGFLLARDGIQPDSSDDGNETPLYHACCFAKDYAAKEIVACNIVRRLLATGKVDVNARDKRGATPLHAAINRGTDSVFETLLDAAKVDVNARTSMGDSPLHCAVQQGRAKAVELLLTAPGVDVNARNSRDETPLHVLTDDGGQGRRAQSIARMLLDTGKVDVNSQTKDGKTPRDLALERQCKDIAKTLAEYDGG